ncbi:MAG: transporter substrate-binding domain-containing protein [Halieaceae bacterium]|jgi:ABC-type amino acid transport substrate-binding protein|nr:transporter substrate-binding domain-containing protein [Halieaceae bacterium]
MLKTLKNLSLLGLFTLTIFAAGAQAESTSPVLDRIVDFKVLKVGMSGNQPPMNSNSRSGQLIGYEVDLARALASSMGARLEIVTMPFGDLLGALDEEKVDMVMSGMAITAARSRDVTFVGPYMMSGKSILTKDSLLARATDTKDFNRGDLKLAALENSTSEIFVQAAAPEAKLVRVKDYDAAVDMVIAGEVDALVADMPICILSVLRYPNAGLATLQSPLSIEPFGIAVRKDDKQFAELVDNYLDTFGKMGMLNQLRKKWFEDKSWIAALP